MNALNNPRFVATPSEDGDLPFPLMSFVDASDVTWLTGPILEAFFDGLGLNPVDAQTGGPITGAQLLATLNSIALNHSDRLDLLGKLAASVYSPPARYPIYLKSVYTGYNPATVVRTALIGGNYMTWAANIQLMLSGGYDIRSLSKVKYENIRSAATSVYSSWGSPVAAVANDAVAMAGSIMALGVCPYIEAINIDLSSTNTVSTRTFELGLFVSESNDFDWSIPVSFVLRSPLAAAQFDEISITVLDANGGRYFNLDLSDLFNGTTNYLFRIRRVAGVLSAGCTIA